MPFYTFRNKNTGEEFTEMMSMSSREKYLAENSNIEQVITGLNIADSVSIGVTKPPADFQKHVLGRVKQMPGASAVANKRWGIPKEI